MSENKVPHRNPYIGTIIAALMLGFSIYRFYEHYALGVEMPSWRFWMNAAIFVYGAYVAIDLIIQYTKRGKS
jgi:hypothetical protein